MFRARQREFLPWYRKPGYRGSLTEEEKRHLDAVRDGQPHPAVTYEQLAEEAQSYISQLELEAYDAKQGALAARTFLLSALGAFLIDANFLHLLDVTNPWAAAIAVPLLILPWPIYFWRWRRNADEFIPPSATFPDWPNPTDEALDYISKRASRERVQ